MCELRAESLPVSHFMYYSYDFTVLIWTSALVLAALLGEMDKIQGEVYFPKEQTRLDEKTGLPLKVAYCAQQPWLEHSELCMVHLILLAACSESIKDNMQVTE